MGSRSDDQPFDVPLQLDIGQGMTWFVQALLAAVLLALQAVAMQKLSRTVKIENYMAACWLGAGLVLVFFAVPDLPTLVQPEALLVLPAAAASWLGMYSYNRALSTQSNIGYVEAISSCRVLLLYFASILIVMHGPPEVEPIKLLAVALTVLGVFLTISSTRRDKLPAPAPDADGSTGTHARTKWFGWSVLSAVAFATLILLTASIVMSGGDIVAVSGAVLIVSGILFAIHSGVSAKTLLPYCGLRGHGTLLIATIVVASAGNLMLFSSSTLAPNLAYASAIAAARVALLYLYSIIFHLGNLSPAGLSGTLLLFVAVILLT